MKKIIIGISPTVTLGAPNSLYDDVFKFVKLYSKKIYQANGIPVGILANNEHLNYDSLKMCDAFLIPGGNKVYKYLYKLIFYAIKNDKPLLGVCLGAEALDIFSTIYEKIDNRSYYRTGEAIDIYKKLKKENDGTMLRRIDSPNMHGNTIISKNNYGTATHSINITKDSLLYSIYKKERMDVVSLHHFDFKHVGKDFNITARADDKVCEAIELNDKSRFVLGVHFHPELFEDNLIFERLVKEAQQRKI